VGGNLYLAVASPKARSWLFRYMLNRVSREMGLGPYPDVSLARAREKAAEARRLKADVIVLPQGNYGSAIGEGIARTLASRGWAVAVTDINLDLAQKVANLAGSGAQSHLLDTTDRVQVDAIVSQLLVRHGAIDALVNASGGMRGLGIPKTDFADMAPETWKRLLTVNFESVLNCTHAVLPA
jgi:NADP-dependent 3-hydroxy acid dehydrogenase YdfG